MLLNKRLPELLFLPRWGFPAPIFCPITVEHAERSPKDVHVTMENNCV